MPPQIDSEHRGPLINVAAWITLVAMILFVSSKVATKWRMVKKWQNDDILMIIAMLAAVGQCVASSFQVRSGLGQLESTLDAQTFERYQKATYVSEILYVITIYIAKMAALQFLIALTRPNPNELDWRRKTVIGTLYFVGIWLVVALFCILFQCKAPHTWDEASGRCFNQLDFWIANGVVDVVTQLLVGLTPIYLLMNLQLSAANKRLAMAAFAPNITTIPLTILRVYYLNKNYRSSDTTLTAFTPTLITVIHTNYSIIASCMPFLKPIFDSLSIGLMTNAINIPEERIDESSGSRSRNPDGKINPFAILGGKGYKTRNAYGWTRFPKESEYTSEVVGGKEYGVELGVNLERYGSRDRMVINQTRTVTVEESEPRALPPVARTGEAPRDPAW